MKTILALTTTAGLLAAYWFASASTRDQASEVTSLKSRKPMAGKPRTPVLVELFTSEGCSSCPSADAQLAQFVRDQPVENAVIIPLSQHVDYWNNIGWKDPFSSAQFSARQRVYGETLRLGSVYTPQMIVDGDAEFVGSDRAQAVAAIRSAAARPKASVTVTVSAETVTVKVSGAPKRTADVMVAITEDGLSSNVRAGENSGRRLAHVAVVRSLRRIGRLKADGTFDGSVALALDKGWKQGELSAVAFLQEPGNGRVLGAAMAEIGAP